MVRHLFLLMHWLFQNRPDLIVRESTRDIKWPPRTPNRAFSVDRVKYVVAVLIRFNKGI